MKLLLDENLPKKLKHEFQEYSVYSVAEMGWAGKTNGALLQLMREHDFSALLTFDKNLQHQQNFIKYSVTVFVLNAPNNTYHCLQPLAAKVKLQLQNELPPGTIIINGE
jgi:predicted nuclease of predicted toxin-antitoxin system